MTVKVERRPGRRHLRRLIGLPHMDGEFVSEGPANLSEFPSGS